MKDSPQFNILHSKFSIHTAAFVFFATIATLSAQKHGGGMNAPPQGASPPRMAPPVPSVVPGIVDYAGPLMPTNMPPVTNLCFWGLCRGTNSVSLGLAWPPAISFTNDCIDLYGSWRLSTNGWARLAEVDVSSAASNAVVELPFSSFPTNAMEESAFFAAADQADTDSDGLSDAFESLVSGSSPSMQDTDGDGLPDGDEVVMGSSPSSSDTDGDGLSDSAEAGAVEVVPSPSWKGMYGTPENVWSATLNSDSGSFLVNLRHPYTVNGVVYSRACLCVDGILYLLDPEYQGGPVYAQIWEPPSLAADELSQEHVTIAAFCADLQVRASAWGSWAVCGTAYLPSGPATAIDIYDIGFNSEYMSQNPHLLSYQILLPSGEPNVVYLTYRPMTPSSYFAGRSPAIGVQLSALPPARPGEQYYNVSWTPSQDSFASMLGLKITIGTGTSPSSSDTDMDGFTDLDETNVLHTDPNEPDDDTDSDGLPDAAELRVGSDPNAADTDCDGLGDLEEYILGTSPLQPDSDGDGMNDGWERRYMGAGFDPTVDNAADSDPDNDIDADPDDDGLENGEECEWGTDPGDPDTDGDGVNDGAEVAQNSDPTDAGDGGLPNTRIPVPFYFGDHSGSHSEKYRLTVTPTVGVGQTPASFSWLNEDYGQCETKAALLKPGWKYEVRLTWAACKYPPDGSNYPNYDYTLSLGQNLPDCVVLEDPDSLFRSDYYGEDYYGASHFPVLDSVAYVYVLAPPAISAPSAVGVNNDDDNGNGTPDWEESGAVAGDDDLGEVSVSVLCPSGFYGTVEMTPLVGATAGTLWKGADRLQSLDTTESYAVPSSVSTRTYYAEGHNPSSHHEAEGVRAVFRCGGAALTNEFRFTFVERTAEPITTVRSGGQIVNPCCAVVGGTTKLKVDVLPNDFPEDRISWRVVSGSGTFSDSTGREAVFVASGDADEDVVVQVDVGDCPGRAPQFTMLTTTMHEVKIYPCAVSVPGESMPISQAQIDSMLDEVNAIYRQVGLHFSLGAPLMCVTNETWATDGLLDSGVGAQIRNIMNNTDGLEVYFIPGKSDRKEPLGSHGPKGIIAKATANAHTIAHEIGHACGWRDVYHGPRNAISSELMCSVKQSWMPLDWNNGTGVRFYDPMLLHSELIPRLLMFGYGGDTKSDIPMGSVHGRTKDGSFGLIPIGRCSLMTTSPHSL